MKSRPNWRMILAVLFVGYILFHGNRGLWKMARLQQEKRVLARDVVRLRDDVARYRGEMLTYGQNPAAVEKQAREELNLVKSGEIIYKFGPVSR